MSDAIYLCRLPADQQELGTGELLSRIVVDEDKPKAGQVTSPKLWTVQERAFVVAHYLAHVVEGGPDFAIGESGKFSSYFPGGVTHCPDFVDAGTAAGDTWTLYPLLGGFAESIERLIVAGELPSDRQGWLVGAMAAQLVASGDARFDLEAVVDAAIDDFLTERATSLLGLPESEFIELLEAYMVHSAKLQHIFLMELSDDGVVFLPASEEAPGLPPARFPFPLACREVTERVFGLPR